MRYSYSVDQVQLKQGIHFFGDSRYQKGDTITVRYLVASPKVSYVVELEQAQITEACINSLLGVGSWIICFFIIFGTSRRLMKMKLE